VSSLAGRSALRRYSRHLLIPEIGLAGQERLLRARVLVVGAGGLGSPVLAYLAAAGVGRIGIVDDDVVDETNLQRQVLFAQADLGRPKSAVAAERVAALNPQVAVDPYPVRFDASNARELVRPYDVVVDATDTFGSRYLVNDAARLEGKPEVYGAIFRFDGQVSVFAPGGPCYRCLFPEPPPAGSVPTCAEGGVLGALAGIVGALQANEALKLVLGIGEPLAGRLLLVDALGARTREFALQRDPACILCGPRATLTGVTPQDAPEPLASGFPELEASELDAFLISEPSARLLDVRERHEAALGFLPGSLHVPASELEARLHELDSAKTYVVACRIGARSRWAAARLADAGFRRIYHLREGLLAYAAAGAAIDIF
jgi:adenylyltransferase/sulfurtransferase